MIEDAKPGDCPATAPAAPRRKRLDAEVLFRDGAEEVEIIHAGEIYRLRRTRAGKLILTK